MSGASARLSRLHTPVETGTPPYRRGKLHSLRFRRQTFRLPRRKLCIVSLPLLFDSQTLRWFTNRVEKTLGFLYELDLGLQWRL